MTPRPENTAHPVAPPPESVPGLQRRWALFFGYLLMKKHAPKMMYKVNRESRCPDCYAKLKGATDFCPKCGKDLTERSESRFCWNCGYEELDKNSTSCPKCGREYKK